MQAHRVSWDLNTRGPEQRDRVTQRERQVKITEQRLPHLERQTGVQTQVEMNRMRRLQDVE